jgi:hypothetical protein
MRIRRMLLLLALGVLAAVVGVAQGGENTVPANVMFSPVVPPRTGAPAWVDIQFDTQTEKLLEGCLEVTVSDGTTPIAGYRSNDMALTAGKQTFRLMLPPVSTSMARGDTVVSPVFRTEEGVYRFQWRPLSIPQQEKREFVVCVAALDVEMHLATGDMASSLRLESYDPESVPGSARTYVTHVASLRPQEFPTSPLPCCCFDIVVLPAEGFGRLQARQLDALRCWVEGGGSVCVMPRGGLKRQHEQFLNDLAGSPEQRFHVDPTGQIDGTGHPDGIVTLRPGLGRAVVVLPETQNRLDTTSSRWREAVAFLWKLRAKQTQPFVDGGHWQAEKPDESQRWDRSYYSMMANGGQYFGYMPIEAMTSMQQYLMPENVRMVPGGILLLMFLGFLAAIGPFDYWLLGRLRRRALTWLLFPAFSIGFAGLVVYMSQRYMGSENNNAGFVFLDVDRTGRVLRWSRCEMDFAGRAHTAQTRVQNAFCGPLDEVYAWYGARRGYRSPGDFVPLYSGRLPFDFVLTRRMGQWEPMFSRWLSFEARAVPTRLNWQALEDADVSTYRGRARAAEKLIAGTSFDGSLFAMQGGAVVDILGTSAGPDASGQMARQVVRFQELKNLIQQVSARPSQGVFSLISQLSPGGPASLEDLSVLDPTDPSQQLLIAVERVGRDYYVYRCLFCGED